MSTYHGVRKTLADALMDAGAVRTAADDLDRVLTFDLRIKNDSVPGPVTERIVDLAARCMHAELARKLRLFNAVIGISQAGSPFARRLADIARLPYLTLELLHHRDGEKYPRTLLPVNGTMPEIRNALLVDGSVRTGSLMRRSVDFLRHDKIGVTDAIALIDRERDGREALSQIRCSLHSVFTATELLELCATRERRPPYEPRNHNPSHQQR